MSFKVNAIPRPISVLGIVGSLYHKNLETLKEYNAHFEFNEMPKDVTSIVWESKESETHLTIHRQITDLIHSFHGTINR